MTMQKLFKFVLICFILVFLSCGSSSIDIEASFPCAPAESPTKGGYYSKPTPPQGFSTALGWLQALQNTNVGGASRIEVDWMRLHAVINDDDIIIASEEFDTILSYLKYYGLYKRSPWFAGEKIESMPFHLSNGCFIIEPSNRPDMVFHWWTQRALVPAGTSRVWFEAKIRITGAAHLQGGIDYWRDLNARWAGLNVNNTEAGASPWECKQHEWVVISVGKP